MNADNYIPNRRFSAVLCGAIALALALLTYFQFPGHTWLQQDSQLYVPILEHQRDAAVLRNDPVAQHPHTAYTLYDETAVALSKLTGLNFHQVLAAEQILTRALGIWGLYLMATAAGLAVGPAWMVAMIVSLGASIAGPLVLTFEYEPTPRAFAVPLVWCAMGLTAHRRLMAAAVAGTCAVLLQFPAALPFWVLFAIWCCFRRWPTGLQYLLPPAVAMAILLVAAHGTDQSLWGRLTPLEEQLLRMRNSYVWISTWPPPVIWNYVVITAILLAAWVRVRRALPHILSLFLIGMAAMGVISMPISWLLLEHWKLRLVAEFQPMRWLLFVALAMQFLTALAGALAARDRRFAEAGAWFVAAFLLPLQPVLTDGFTWRQTAVALGLAALATAAVAFKAAPVAGLAAFFAVPLLGGVVLYPPLHTPELAGLSAWARASTPRDAVFLFADAGRSVEPGIFRSEALRAVYVDWKSGGQMAYLREFGLEWWIRWEQTAGARFRPADVPKYEALGIQFVVLGPPHRLPRAAAFENSRYLVYDTHTGTPARQSR